MRRGIKKSLFKLLRKLMVADFGRWLRKEQGLTLRNIWAGRKLQRHSMQPLTKTVKEKRLENCMRESKLRRKRTTTVLLLTDRPETSARPVAGLEEDPHLKSPWTQMVMRIHLGWMILSQPIPSLTLSPLPMIQVTSPPPFPGSLNHSSDHPPLVQG